MDEQYVVDNIDYLELTKRKNRKDHMKNYGALPDSSDRSNSSSQSIM